MKISHIVFLTSSLMLLNGSVIAAECSLNPLPNSCDNSSSTHCQLDVSRWGVTTANADNSSCFKKLTDFATTQSINKTVDIQFGNGTYKFSSPVSASAISRHSSTMQFSFNDSRIAITNKTSNNLLQIKGRGKDGANMTRLEFIGFQQNNGVSTIRLNGISVLASKYVSISDLSLTHDRYPFSQGIIEPSSINSRTDTNVIIKMDAGYGAPQPFARNTTDKSFIVTYKSDTTFEKVPSDIQFEGFTDLGGGRYELLNINRDNMGFLYNYHRNDTTLKVTLSPKIGGESLYFYNSDNITGRNIDISNAPAVAIRSWAGGSNLMLDNVNYIRRHINTNSDIAPLMAGTAGGYIIQALRGGLTIKNSLIDHNADDTLGLFSQNIAMTAINSASNQVTVNEKKAQSIHLNDILDIFSSQTLRRSHAKLTVIGINSTGDGNLVLTLDKAFSGANAGDYIGSRSATIGLPGNRFKIQNNVLRHNKGRGIRANASFGDITNNTLTRNGNGGVWLGSDDGSNGQCNSSVTVSNNTFNEQLHGPSVLIHSARGRHVESTEKCQKNITINNNTINNQAKNAPGIFVDNVNKVTINSNTLTSEFSGSSVIKTQLDERLDSSGISKEQRKNTMILSNYAKKVSQSNNSSARGKNTVYSKTANTK